MGALDRLSLAALGTTGLIWAAAFFAAWVLL
jgi:hypothetical protein